MKTKPKTLAIIPARSGSKRIPNKNITLLGKHPMLAYSINVAIKSGFFDEVICSTDSPEYAEIAEYYGAKVPFLRSKKISGDSSPDIDWVTSTIFELEKDNKVFDIFSILRPTSPFRTKKTIQSAFKLSLLSPSTTNKPKRQRQRKGLSFHNKSTGLLFLLLYLPRVISPLHR